MDKKYGPTSLNNTIFQTLFNSSLFVSSKYSFLFRILKVDLFFHGLPKNSRGKKLNFLTKKRTNPFEKFDLLDLFETSLFCSKKYSFLSRILENDLFCLLCLKKQHGNKLDFLIKTWTYPFEKLDFSDVLETSLFWSKKYSFLSTILKNNLFRTRLPKKPTW